MAGQSSAPTTQQVQTTTSNLPEYARPYFENLMGRAQAWSNADYQPYPYERIAGFTPAQEQIQQSVLDMQAPNQFALGSGLASLAGQGSMMAGDYTPAQFAAQQINIPALQQYQMQAAQTGFQPNVQALTMGNIANVGAQNVSAPTMQAAQTDFGRNLNLRNFLMDMPAEFGQAQAQQYMSPYIQNVLDIQKREAARDAQRSMLAEDLGAARQGAYGGSRQLLATMERERNLGQNMADIQARGLQSAYENAQQQFERDRAARMGAERTNIESQLGVQQLGTQTGLQAALANLSADQQARVNNQAIAFQASGMNAENALRAALANQQTQFGVGQANLQAGMRAQEINTEAGLQAALANLNAAQQAGVQNLNALLGTQDLQTRTGLQAALANQQQALDAQRLGEQSRQFGAQQLLSGFGQAGQMAQTLGNLGQLQQQTDLQRLQAQASAAEQPRTLEQQYLDQMYADFLRQRDYPMEQISYLSNILRGVPVNLASTQTTYATPPTLASQVLGGGLGALGMYKTLGG